MAVFSPMPLSTVVAFDGIWGQPVVGDEVYGTSESGVNDERSDEKGRRYRIVVVVTCRIKTKESGESL